METFLNYIKNLFTPNPNSALDAFIKSHNPTSIADIESLCRQFDIKTRRALWD